MTLTLQVEQGLFITAWSAHPLRVLSCSGIVLCKVRALLLLCNENTKTV